MIRFLAIAVLALSISTHADEVDHWTGNYQDLPDSADIINERTNDLFDVAVNESNSSGGSCDKKDLYRNLRRYFHNRFFGKFNRWLHVTDDFSKVQLRVRESVYAKLSPRDAWMLGGFLKIINAKLSGVVRVGDHLVGTDKFDHFLSTGYRLSKKFLQGSEAVEITLDRLRQTEYGLLGARATGIISSGDIAADFNGLRFWSHLLAEIPDPLGPEYQLGPYVICEQSKWVRVKHFNWLNYIDDAWDESKNCNNYKNQRVQEKVENRTNNICDGLDPSVTQLRDTKYGNYSSWIFSEKVLQNATRD